MKIKTRGLNKNECFICSLKDVKDVFCQADIDVYFGLTRETNFKRKGHTVALLTFFDDSFGEREVSLFFYHIKKDDISTTIYKQFVNEIMPELFNIYLLNVEKNKHHIVRENFGYYVVKYEEDLVIEKSTYK